MAMGDLLCIVVEIYGPQFAFSFWSIHLNQKIFETIF